MTSLPRIEPHQPSRGYRRYVLTMLTLVSTLNFVDRQIMSILMEPIKQEFYLSDTQLGFMTGFAFAIFYATVGFLFAKLADTGNRARLIAIVIALWSVMTAISGAATGFFTLLLARIGVGVGESGSSPAGQSMLADYYPASERASAIATQSIGVYIGIMLGFLAGGWFSQYYGWRTAFVIVGLPGVMLAFVFWLTVREPVRGAVDGVVDTGSTPPLRESIVLLLKIPSYRNIAIALCFYAFAVYGSMAWAPSFFMRSHGLSSAEVGTWLSLAAGVGGGLGCYLGGIASDWLARRTGDRRWYLMLPALCSLATVPLLFGVYLLDDPYHALMLSAVVWFLGNTWLGPVQATVLGLAGLRRRAVAAAVLLFFNNLFGNGLGPQIVGILSDWFQPTYGVNSLRYALLWPLGIATLISSHFFLRAASTVRHDLADSEVA